jgi:hypothetical protein
MRKWVILAALACAALTFVAIAAADPPSTKGPYNVTTTDGGCGGNQWANDTISRTFEVKKAQNDSSNNAVWRLKRVDKGTFSTIAGLSPGNCASNTSAHGTTVTAGITGRINGFLQGTVTGGTYNPNATCTGACASGQTDAWVAAYFGSSAQFSCFSTGPCTFEFHYTAPGQHLQYRHWIDKGTEAGETFTGDIATS